MIATQCVSLVLKLVNQFYVGTDCTHAFKEDFVLDIGTKQCEFYTYDQ